MMNDFPDQATFDQFVRTNRAHGQNQLQELLRTTIEALAPGTRALVDEIEDDAVLRAELFVHVRDRGEAPGSLAELIWTLLPESSRPSLCPMTSDDDGVVVLPGLGILRTKRPNEEITVVVSDDSEFCALVEDEPVESTFEPTTYVPGHPFEVTSPPHATLRSLLPTEDGERGTPVAAVGHLAALETACDLIALVDPEYYRELVACVRQICLFHHPSANSYADMAGHGCIFINVRWPPSVPFFVDELCHQGGHVVLRAACLERHRWLVDPSLPLSALGAAAHDDRSLYSLFHGVYTEHMIARVLERIDVQSEVCGEAREEVFGRLVQIHDKHHKDLAIITRWHERSLTGEGRALVEYFQRCCERLSRARPELQLAKAYHGSYEFDFAGYRATNPPRDHLVAAARHREVTHRGSAQLG